MPFGSPFLELDKSRQRGLSTRCLLLLIMKFQGSPMSTIFSAFGHRVLRRDQGRIRYSVFGVWLTRLSEITPNTEPRTPNPYFSFSSPAESQPPQAHRARGSTPVPVRERWRRRNERHYRSSR